MAGPSRRSLVIGGGAVLVVGGAGAATLAVARPEDLIFGLMRQALPGVDLERGSVGECARDVLADLDVSFQGAWLQRAVSHLKLKAIRAASEVVGLDAIDGLGPVEARLQEITRMAVTRLLLNSNFFDLADPRAAPIRYRRPEPNAACVNRFANLGPPAA